MVDNNTFQMQHSTSEQSSIQLSPLEDLITFLKFYLGPDQASRFENKAKYHVLHPDESTKRFVDDVFKAVNDKLKNEHRGLNEATETLIKRYNKQMRKAQNCKRVGNLYGNSYIS